MSPEAVGVFLVRCIFVSQNAVLCQTAIKQHVAENNMIAAPLVVLSLAVPATPKVRTRAFEAAANGRKDPARLREQGHHRDDVARRKLQLVCSPLNSHP